MLKDAHLEAVADSLAQVHHQDALEAVVDRQVAIELALGLNITPELVLLSHVFRLAELEVIEPRLCLELLAFEGARRVVLHLLDLLGNGLAKIEHAVGVARVKHEFRLAQLDSTGVLIVPVEQVPGQSIEILSRPRVDLAVQKVEDSDVIGVVAD